MLFNRALVVFDWTRFRLSIDLYVVDDFCALLVGRRRTGIDFFATRVASLEAIDGYFWPHSAFKIQAKAFSALGVIVA